MFNMNKFLTPLMKAVHELPDIKAEEQSAAKRPRSKVKAAEEGKKQRVKKEKVASNNGFNKPLRLSASLSNLLGEAELSRPQIVKHMWNYIKENSLQDPADRRNIICDDRLREVFGVKK
jgi:upstream activation factor subunit UAF30